MAANEREIPKRMCRNPTYLSLPNQWDTSVSYEENLAMLTYNYNLIVEYLENLTTDYQSYTDNAINSLRNEVYEKYDAALVNLKNYIDTQDEMYWQRHVEDMLAVNTRITELRNYVDINFADIRQKHLADYNQLNSKIDTVQSMLITYTDNAIAALKDWTLEQIDDILDKVDEVNEDGFRIYNPTTGLKDRVGNTVNDVYEALRIHAVTAEEHDKWYTAYDHDGSSFKRLMMSALDYDVEAHLIMYEFLSDCVFSPYTGEYIKQNVAIEQVASIPNGFMLTAGERDMILDFSGEDYVKRNWTPYQWDTKGITVYDEDGMETVERTDDGFTREFTEPAELIGVETSLATFPTTAYVKWTLPEEMITFDDEVIDITPSIELTANEGDIMVEKESDVFYQDASGHLKAVGAKMLVDVKENQEVTFGDAHLSCKILKTPLKIHVV